MSQIQNYRKKRRKEEKKNSTNKKIKENSRHCPYNFYFYCTLKIGLLVIALVFDFHFYSSRRFSFLYYFLTPHICTSHRVLLEFLGLSPSSKSARKVLDLTGIWSTHYNIEKYIMGIRDKFPLKVGSQEPQHLK